MLFSDTELSIKFYCGFLWKHWEFEVSATLDFFEEGLFLCYFSFFLCFSCTKSIWTNHFYICFCCITSSPTVPAGIYGKFSPMGHCLEAIWIEFYIILHMSVIIENALSQQQRCTTTNPWPMSTGCTVGLSHCLCLPTYSSWWGSGRLLGKLNTKLWMLLQTSKMRRSHQYRW